MTKHGVAYTTVDGLVRLASGTFDVRKLRTGHPIAFILTDDEHRELRYFVYTDPHHAHTNLYVMRDLSRHLFQRDRVENIDVWKALPAGAIQRASTELLLKNTRDLKAAGARTVRSVIK